ncbi:glycosyltransferase [Microbacterium sp. 4R-513]|uniref:glycosyltransferase n=1 Tax=Microbacterium sp. 4R-513 TaxID=2567934 RepID=UPI0013E1476E|nr:glycosyltransferase [Microbacterium sp. 4R-513]QIG40195.1 glycosyltransferase [Microbacterium sp. 4R-513]
MTRFGILSTYPPTRCGLANFTHALEAALTESGHDTVAIVRALDAPLDRRDALTQGTSRPVAELIAGDAGSIRRAAAALDTTDVAIVQHEYGIYGGRDGDEVIHLLETLEVPVIVVLHTVLPAPSTHQRIVLERVCASAASVVVMTQNAREVLLANYRVSRGKIAVIPHGVAARQAPDPTHARPGRRRILTWGLISRGKGLEWGVRAMDELRDLDVEYVIAGQTHPKVRALQGEEYRRHLESLIRELNLEGVVSLDDRYLDRRELDALVATADAVLLPYESTEQATSGVLAEAVAAGIPVVATGFPHAVELLSGGAGLIAGHGDPASMARGLRSILEADDAERRVREAAASRVSPATWPVVAERYRHLARSAMAQRAA